MDGWKHQLAAGKTNGRLQEPMNGWKRQLAAGKTNGRLAEPMNGWKRQRSAGKTNGRLEAPTRGWKNQWTAGRTDDVARLRTKLSAVRSKHPCRGDRQLLTSYASGGSFGH